MAKNITVWHWVQLLGPGELNYLKLNYSSYLAMEHCK